MRDGNRTIDLICLIILIALSGIIYARHNNSDIPVPSEAPAQSSGMPIAPNNPNRDKGPNFQLPRLAGQPLVYSGGGPALITLSAVGCGGCQKRVVTDRQAYDLAHQQGVPVWNMFVYANGSSSKSFQDRFQPRADEFIYDADGAVAVKAYGGSDESCWILLDSSGKIVYRGGSNLALLTHELTSLAKAPAAKP